MNPFFGGIMRNSDPIESQRLKSLEIPDRYLMQEGVLNIRNWRFKKLPPGKGDPKTCVMRYLMQCIVPGCDKLRFVHKIDVNDFELWSQANPNQGPVEVEKNLIGNITQQFASALAYKYDYCDRLRLNRAIVAKVGQSRLPEMRRKQDQ